MGTPPPEGAAADALAELLKVGRRGRRLKAVTAAYYTRRAAAIRTGQAAQLSRATMAAALDISVEMIDKVLRRTGPAA